MNCCAGAEGGSAAGVQASAAIVLTVLDSGVVVFFFFQAEDGIRDYKVTGVQTCALPICSTRRPTPCCRSSSRCSTPSTRRSRPRTRCGRKSSNRSAYSPSARCAGSSTPRLVRAWRTTIISASRRASPHRRKPDVRLTEPHHPAAGWCFFWRRRIPSMQKLLLFVDKLSTWVGQAFSWLIFALTLHITWEVFSRYVLDHPRAWAFDAMIMMYGTLFMMAGAYTLAKNSHVRGDVIYGYFTPRAQAILDLTLYIVFFIPGIVALTYAGYFYAAESWAINEHSNITAEGPPVYPFKTVIPLAGAFVLVQGIVEIIRCIICIRHGAWPTREEDVQEVDVDKLKEELHVKDEDIQKLDQYVVAKERGK